MIYVYIFIYIGVLGSKVWEIVIDCFCFHIHNTTRDYQITHFSRGLPLKCQCAHKSLVNYLSCKFLFTRCVCVCVCVHMRTCAQLLSCVWLCDSMDCSPPGSCVHGIPQARILEWVTISSSRGSSWPRDQTCVSCNSCTGRQILLSLYHLGSIKVSISTKFPSAGNTAGHGFTFWMARFQAFPDSSVGKESSCNAGFDSWVRKIPWRRERWPTSVF